MLQNYPWSTIFGVFNINSVHKTTPSYQSKRQEGPERPKCLIRLSSQAPKKKLTHVLIAMISTVMRMEVRAMYNVAGVEEMPKCGFGFVTWCLFGCG